MKASWFVLLLTWLLAGLVDNFYAALNDGDAEAVARHYLEGANSFQRIGFLLTPVRSAEYLNARFEAGLEFAVEADQRGSKIK